MGERVAQDGLSLRIAELIGPRLGDVERCLASELAAGGSCVADLVDHVRRFPGKRLRPMLLLVSAEACGKVIDEHVVLATVVELIHTATLVHDDVLDEAPTRRHLASLNARFGVENSVLFGDYLFTHAFYLASTLESTRACRLIGRATNTVCAGELRQKSVRGNLALEETEYFEIVAAKTGALCAVACRLGAEHAGADRSAVEGLEEYGRELGMAFQVADDLLDLVGDEAIVGKPVGADAAQQTLTLPVIRLLSTADAATVRRVRELLSTPGAATREALLPLLDSVDAIEYARERAEGFARAAVERLNVLPASPARELLTDFATYVTARRR